MKKKIKLAVFVDGDFIPSYDGASNRFHYLSRYLSKQGIDLTIFHGYRGWSNISLIKKEPFKTYVFPIDNYYNNLELIASILIKEGVNIIQFDNLEPILLQGIKLSKLTGAKLVSEMHYVVRSLAKRLGADNERLSEIEKIEYEVGKNIDHLICLSEQDKPSLIKYLNIDADKVSVIPSGVDINEIKYFVSDFKSRNIVFLGNLYFKPNEDAVRIIKEKVYPKLKDQGFKFTVGGDCPPDIQKELTDKNFTFIGTVPNLNDLFKNATFALAPIFEGTGMRIKLLNYLAAGIPVITTSIATNGFNQKEAFIVEDDVSKYADIILDLVNDKRKLKNVSKRGHKIIKKFYDWKIVAKRTIKTYKNILKERNVEKFGNHSILKTKEPLWLQEAVAKQRFKQIKNPSLPKDFSYCVIENNYIKDYTLKKIVALEGMPGAGKTTFINSYVKNNGNIKFLPQLEIKNRKILERDNLETTKMFLSAEKEKSDLINQIAKENKEIVIDRTFLTTLAYCYARSKKLKNDEYSKLIEFYNKIKEDITFPTKLIFLDVENKRSLERRRRFANNPDYSNWFDEEFLNHMREFYKKEISKFINIKVDYVDTTSMSIEEVSNTLKEII